jgi:hypothetical protein
MGTLLNRRRYMGGGGSLPYDAEIEYLQSTGTQMIISNVTFNAGLHVTAYALYTGDFSSTQILFAPSGDAGCWCGNVATKKWGITATGFGDSSVKTRIDVYYSQKTDLYIDGVFIARQTRSVTPSTPIAIFDRYNPGRKSKAKLYYILIQDSNDNYLFEGIPVRVGQVGYLYDKVSGQLFGNAGTGDFVLGNDL